MTITAEQIDLWRSSASETRHLEFKQAKAQYDTTKLRRYCIAIANEGGGHLVLGVADTPPRAVVGSQAFMDTQAIAEKLFHWLGFRVDVEAVSHPDGRVPAPATSRPGPDSFNRKPCQPSIKFVSD